MALNGADLAKVVDDTVQALRIKNPTWLGFYGASLPARVQEMLIEGAAGARKHETWRSGGVRIDHEADGEFTEVYVLVATIYDEGTLTCPDD
jgi:hypothetical protein